VEGIRLGGFVENFHVTVLAELQYSRFSNYERLPWHQIFLLNITDGNCELGVIFIDNVSSFFYTSKVISYVSRTSP